MVEFEPLLEAPGHTHQPDTRGMPLPLSGTDSVVSGAFEALLDMGRGRNSVNRVTQSSAEGHPFRGELDASCAVDRVKRDEISRADGTNSGINTCH